MAFCDGDNTEKRDLLDKIAQRLCTNWRHPYDVLKELPLFQIPPLALSGHHLKKEKTFHF